MKKISILIMLVVVGVPFLFSCQKHSNAVSNPNFTDSMASFPNSIPKDSLSEFAKRDTTAETSQEHIMTKVEYDNSEIWHFENWPVEEEYYRFYHQAVVKSKKKGISLDSVLRYYSHSELPYDSVVKWYTNDSYKIY